MVLGLRNLVGVVAAVALILSSATATAVAITAQGSVEISVKANGDLINARRVARGSAERDAVRSALKLGLNLDTKNPKAEEAIAEIAKNLTDNLKTTFTTEGDVLTAKTTLQVDSAKLTDLSRSLGLASSAAMEAASILFLVDEYFGVGTKLDPSKPLVSEVEYFHDKSSASDTSSKVAASSSSSSAMAASSKESAAYVANQKTAVAGSSASSYAGSDRRAVAVQDGSGAAAAARDTQVAGAQKQSFAGSSSSNVAASRDSDTRVAASSAKSAAYAGEQKNIQSQKDIVSIKTKTVFPDMGNAKPADDSAALITQRLEQVTKQYGIQYTPERDFRVAGGRKLLVGDIEKLGQFDQYTEKAGKNPYNAKYVVFGSSVSNAEGTTASGATTCSGMLKLSSFNVDTGRGLASGTLNKRAQGTSDQDCRSNLATALATELAQTIGSAATRELQLIAAQGQSYTLTLYSALKIPRRIGSSFEDKLTAMVGDLREDKNTEAARTYILTWKGGNLRKKVEALLDELGDGMKDAEVQTKGNRMIVCIEGKCPKDY